MAEVTQIFRADHAIFDVDILAPLIRLFNGSNFSPLALQFGSVATERTFFPFVAAKYPGAVTLDVDIFWTADTATSGDVVWEVALAAITPNSDSGSWLTKAFATATTGTDSHLGTQARRLHKHTITISTSNNDALAENDFAVLRVSRLGADGGDTLSDGAVVPAVLLRYNDA